MRGMTLIAIACLGLAFTFTVSEAQDPAHDSVTEANPEAGEVDSIAEDSGVVSEEEVFTNDELIGRTYSSVIIANVPRTLSNRLIELGERMSTAAGVELQPQWWHLDLAAFSTNEAVDGLVIAEKLGLNIVSGASDDLILSVLDARNPRARQAEARMFIKRVFMDKPRNMWDGLSNFNSDDMHEMIDASFSGKLLRSTPQQGAEQKASMLKESNVFATEGKLTDEKVQNTLGVSAKDLEYPLKHYQLDDFTIGPIPRDDSNNYYYDYSSNDTDSAGVVIRAKVGIVETDIPHGPTIGNAFSSLPFYFWFGGMDFALSNSYWDYGYDNSEKQESVSTEATFVAAVFDKLEAPQKPAPERADIYREKIRAAANAKDAHLETIKAVYKEAMLEGRRNHVAKRVSWGDPTAVKILSDAEDDLAHVRSAKRELVAKATEVMTKYHATAGEDRQYLAGDVADWETGEHYGYQYYQDFRNTVINVHSLSWELDEKDDVLSGIFLVCDSNETGHAFKVHIDPASGKVTWHIGEPESEEIIRSRQREIDKVAQTLAQAALDEEGEEVVFNDDWISSVVNEKLPGLLFAAAIDFSAISIVPGLIYIEGEFGPGSRQAFLVDRKAGTKQRVTLAPEFK